jgi:hypothetical protein
MSVPEWLQNQIALHVEHLESWARLYGSEILDPEQKWRLVRVAAATNKGDPRIINPIIFCSDAEAPEPQGAEGACPT